MKTLTIQNSNLQTKLNGLAEVAYQQIATYKNQPLPNISLQRLRELMKDTNSSKEEDNCLDYAYRDFSREWKDRKKTLLGSFNLETNTTNWYYDEILVQPPEWGWSSWNCNSGKPKNFIRFIHNAGVGFTNWVEGGKWSYIPDNTGWTVIAGTMDGDQWLSDRNRSAKPRFVLEVAIPSYNSSEWNKALEIVENA